MRDDNDDSLTGPFAALIWAVPLGAAAWVAIIWSCWAIWEMVW